MLHYRRLVIKILQLIAKREQTLTNLNYLIIGKVEDAYL